MEVEFVEIETNMPEFIGAHCNWAHQFHGAGLAASAMLLSDRLERVAIASTNLLSKLVPWGSHPLTDPLWSTPGFEVVHSGAESTRFDQVERIAESDVALRFLRVCWENIEGQYNCGRCEKCLRTMVALQLCGALERCPAFASDLDLSLLPDIRFYGEGNRSDWNWNLRATERYPDPDLTPILEELMAANENAQVVKLFARHNRGMLASPEWRRLLPKVRNKLWKSLKGADREWFVEKLTAESDEFAEEVFQYLWQRRRKWLKREMRNAKRARLKQRCGGLLGRIGGRKS